MKKFYSFAKSTLLACLSVLLFSQALFAQTDVSIGTGTNGNAANSSTTGYPCPIQDYYEGSRAQYLYLASELTAAGMNPGTITNLKWLVTTLNSFSGFVEQFTIRIGGTTLTSLNLSQWETLPATPVFGPVDYVAKLGVNDFLLTTPFVWNGSDNIIIETCNGDPNNASGTYYTQNPTIPWTTGLAFNGSHNYRIDGAGNLCGSATVTNSGLATSRPNIVFSFIDAGPCTTPPTAGTAVSNKATVCSGESFTLSLSGNTTGSGQTYQWQSSPDDATWGNIANADKASLTITQSASKWYRCIVTCSGNSANSVSVQVTSPALVGGTFSINSTVPTGGTNFQTFGDAINYIKCGINAPVVFNVAAFSGPYNEQIIIPQIFGASSTNSITINGNGSTLSFSASVSAERALIYLDGADHITIDSLNIDGSAGTYGWGIFFTNGADSNTVKRCMLTTNASSTSTNYMNIAMNGSITSTNTSGNSGNYNTIMNNTLIGGYYGVYMYGQSPAYCVGNKVMGNKIIDPYSYSTYVYGQSGTIISQNDMTRPTRTSSNIVSGAYINVSIGVTVEKNRIHNAFGGVAGSTSSFYGIYLSSADGTPTAPHNINNNLIYDVVSNGTIYGIYNIGSDTSKIYHNTLVFDDAGATAGTTYGFYQTTAANAVDFRNNIVYITRGGTGTKRAVYYATTTSTITSNNNVLYLNSAGGSNNNLGQFGTTNYADLNAWKTANGGIYDNASFSVDPLFVNFNPGDYKPSDASINNIGAGGLGITTDINGTVRTPLPDPGAVEFTLDGCTNPPTAGLAITSNAVVCAGESFTLNLDGNSVGSGQTYQWQVSADNATWANTGTAQTTPVFSTSQTESSYYQCLVKCSAGTAVASTSIYVFKPTVTGAYTINNLLPTAGTNFASFTEAFAYLKCGITGPVVFNVEPFTGPYNEQVTIPQVPGTSAVNTITINGNGASLVWSPTGTGDRTAFTLNGADHIILDSLTIDVSGGATYGWGILLTNQADSNIVRNCTINTATNSTSTNYNGMAISGSTTSASTSGNNGNYNLFMHNTVNGGYYGISMYGSTTDHNWGNQAIGNILRDQYYSGVYDYGQKASVVSGNDISRPTRTSFGTFYSLYLGYVLEGTLVEKNWIHNTYDANTASTSSLYAIYLNNGSTDTGSPGNPNRLENNLISDITGGGIIYGIYQFYGEFWNVYQNTIILDDAASTTSSATRGIWGDDPNMNIRNNIVSISRGGTGTKYTLYFGTTWTGESNNNVLYMNAATGTNYIAYKGSSYSTLADWKASNGSAFDQQSFSVDPLFQMPNPGQFIPSEVTINNIGANLGVATDILGTPRSGNPDPGAFEFSIAGCTNPPLTGIVTTVTTVCPNTNFDLTLTGNSIGENLTFQWQISPDSTNWTNIGTLGTAPLITTSQTFGNFYRCVLKCGAGAPVASAGFYVNSPVLVSGGTYTINSTVPTGGSNFQSFGDAINFMSCGISGAIVFNVEPFTGPYNEQLSIPQIGGASATNTITFNGNGNTIKWTPVGSTDRTAVTLNGSDFVVLDSLTIDVTGGTYGWGIVLTNQADSNIIRHCTIMNDITSTSSNYSGILINGSNSSTGTSGNNGSGNLIEGNTIIGGYYGIYLYGSTSPYNEYNLVKDNMIKDFYYYGVYFYGQRNSTMSGNDVSRPTRTNTSLYAVYSSSNGGGILVEKNKVHNIQDNVASPGTQYCFYISGDGISGNINRFENNIAYAIKNGNSTQYGIYGLNIWYWDVSHNTIILDDASSASGSTYASYAYGSTGMRNYNNIFVVTRGGTGIKVALYGSTTGFTATNNNLLYVNAPSATTAAVGYYSTYYATLANWQTANSGAFDQNSVSFDPLFADAAYGNLLPYEPLLDNAGNALSGVTTDIRGEIRNPATPTPGAFEITTVLPVTLIHLSGTRQSNDVRLDWTTVNEFNNAGFDIERSTDGIRFTKVGYVTTKAPNGNNTGKLSYDYLDVHAPKSDVFYRLKQLDKDGTSELSNVVVMSKIGVDKVDISNVYPNPASRSGALKLQMTSPETSRVTLVITDVTGKVLRQQTEILQSGTNTMDVNVKSLSAGTYFIKAICTDGCETTIKKFIVQ